MDLKIGELAQRMGLTVRTLHHYHEIGLLVPSLHTPGEHRRYTAADLLRLQQIRSLQALGLSLAEVREVLERPDHSPLATVDRHLTVVTEELEAGRHSRERLTRVAEHLRAARELSSSDLLPILEDIAMYEKHDAPEQLESLRRRAGVVGAERIQEVQEEWAEIFRALAEAKGAGESASSEPARRARGLIDESTACDPGIRTSLANLHRAEGGENVMARHGMRLEPGVWDLLQAAIAALEPRA